MRYATLLLLFTLPAWLGPAPAGPEDESVFVKNLRPDQHESLLYVWTSDADAKQPDFLTVVDADPKSPGYGKILTTVPTGSTVDNEAHHLGYTVNADRIFAGGLVSNRLFIYDVKADPKHPALIKTIPDLGALSGYSGPHTYYAVPGGVMIAMLGSKDGTGPGALVRLDEQGNFVSALPAPNRPDDPGYMYDVGVKPELNRMVTSSWTHPHHFRGNPIAPENVATQSPCGIGRPARCSRSSTSTRCRWKSGGSTGRRRGAGSSIAPGRAPSGTGRTRTASSPSPA